MSSLQTPHHVNSTQAELWNGTAGQGWIQAQSVLDALFQPMNQPIMQAAFSSSPVPQCVLDVGCGTGGTTLQAAQQLGKHGTCLGIDISAPMIAKAIERAEQADLNLEFLCADAQTHEFTPGQFDAIISRFGVMFFEDPVQAFTHLHRAAKPLARLSVMAWRSAADNPFMTAAEKAAAPLLPGLPARTLTPGAPGQFAFAQQDLVLSILQTSGWHGAAAQALDIECMMPYADFEHYIRHLGPVGVALQNMDSATERERLLSVLREAFAPYVHGQTVRFTAACWHITAQAT